MAATVSVQHVQPRKLAAVRREVEAGQVGAAWRGALDQVWKFLGTQPGLRTDGHNIFLYHHPAERHLPMSVDFGVEVTRDFAPSGEVRPAQTPAGETAVAVHVGSYDRLNEAYDAIHAWAKAHNRAFAGLSWEIYGDWSDDPARLETTVVYLLRQEAQPAGAPVTAV
jgi:effector-binding domain-containing protein